MKKMIFAAAALVAMTACNTSLIERPQSEYGTISLGITADVEMIETKAMQAVTGNDLNTYNITLTKGSTTVWGPKEYSAINDADLKQSAGAYVVTAENLTETEAESANSGKGAVRVKGTGEVTVLAGQTQSANVECSPVNTKVTVDYAEGFALVFTEPTVTLQNTEPVVVNGQTVSRVNPLPMTAGHVEANAVYYNTTTTATINETQTAVAALTATIKATIGSTQKTFTKTFNAPVAKWTKLTFAAGTDGKMTISISADGTISEVHTLEETIDPTGGTEVTPSEGV